VTSAVPTHLPFSPPTGEECVALGLASRYLLRARTQAVTRLLSRSRVDPEAELLASLADSLLQGAALCGGLTGAVDDRVCVVDRARPGRSGDAHRTRGA